MKRILSLLCVLLFSLLLPLSAAAVVEKSESFYVNDAANVLSPETEERILAINEKLVSDCNNAQLVVVSVPYMDGLYADEYACQLFNDWGVGSDTENNGMLLLFATRENRGWLAVGDGIIGNFTDDMAGLYLDQYFWDYYDAQKYDEGVTALCNALYNWYRDYYGISSGGMTSIPAPPVYYAPVEPAYQRGIRLDSIVILILFLLLLSARRTRRVWGHWGIWPFYYFSPWWAVRTRRYYTPSVWRSHYRSQHPPGYRPPNTSYRPPSGFGGGSSGGFGRGGGFRGGGFGGRSGGGGGRR